MRVARHCARWLAVPCPTRPTTNALSCDEMNGLARKCHPLSTASLRLPKGVAAAAGDENVVVVVSQECRDGSQNTWIIVDKKNGLLFRSDHHGATIRAGICRAATPSLTSQKPA
jgi:hypothetical protein